MATTNHSDSLPPIRVSLPNPPDSIAPATVPTSAPYPPSPVEARYYYYGLPSLPRLVARSSTNAWVESSGPEAYLLPKESRPIGLHPLQENWEATVGPAMIDYLESKGVRWTSLDPVRMGYAGESSFPAIIWMGVVPGSLPARDGIEVATHCKHILVTHGINDFHVEIRDSEVIPFTDSEIPKMYKPVPTLNPTALALEPFSTALGLPICAEATPSIQGTGGFFISDPRYPGKIYLVTARHVVLPLDKNDNNFNELYLEQLDPSQPRQNVLLFGHAAIKKHTAFIKSEVDGQLIFVDHFEKMLVGSQEMSAVDQGEVQHQLDRAKMAIIRLEELFTNVSGDSWQNKKNRVLGHIVLSPPIGLGVGDEKFTEDWAVIEVDSSKVDSTNFPGNVIDLGTTISIVEFKRRMSPHPTTNPPFHYPTDRLLKLCGTIPDEEMWKPSPGTLDQHNDPCIMVIKRGYGSGLTIGRLNTIRSFTRTYLKDKAHKELSKSSIEVCVLPRGSWSGPFSGKGDSGSVVVDGNGRIAGLLTGGSGDAHMANCSYLTSINFLTKRMLMHGLEADLSPSLK